MRTEQDVAFEEFVEWYGEVEYADPYDFQDLGGDTFYFFVKYKDKGEDERKYGVKMVIGDDRLNTIMTEEFMGEEVTFRESNAFSVKRGDYIYLIIEKNGEERIIDEGDRSEQAAARGFGTSFRNLRFSTNGRYLLYTISDYEYTSGCVYDMEQEKTIGKFVGADVSDNFGILPWEDYLYVCVGAGFGEGIPGEVYSLPNMKKVFDASDEGGREYPGTNCEYNENDNSVVFSLGGSFIPESPAPKEVRYYLENDYGKYRTMMFGFLSELYPDSDVRNEGGQGNDYNILKVIDSPYSDDKAILFAFYQGGYPIGMFVAKEGKVATYKILQGDWNHQYIDKVLWENKNTISYDRVVVDEGGESRKGEMLILE